jgi:DNA modification methylase
MEFIAISKVIPNSDNPRYIKEEKFKKLVQSLKDFPEMANARPIVVNKEMVALGGNMRLKAMQEAGWTEVPVKIVDWSEEKQREFIIKDNVGFGEWDWDELANTWNAEELTEWGLDTPDNWGGEELEAEEDDYEVPEELKTDVVLGDLIEIGEHRLICGDSTDSDTVAKLMNGEKAELLFTSPPYSDMRDYNGEKDLSVSNIVEFITSFYQYCEYQVINLGIQRKEGQIFEYWNDYIQKAKDNGYLFLSWNIWNKNDAGSIGNQTAMFAISHEWIFVFGTTKKELIKTRENNTYGQKAGLNRRMKDGSVQKTTGVGIVSNYSQLRTVIDCQVIKGNIGINHPAMFPIELPFEYIQAMTDENKIIAEPFLGSGSTMVAAHQLKRKCYGMELDPKYCQVIIDRMTKLDPTLSVKINGNEYVKTEE